MKNRFLVFLIFMLSGIVVLLLTGVFMLFIIPEAADHVFQSSLAGTDSQESTAILAADEAKLRNQVSLLNKKLKRLDPGPVYLVINTTDNSFKFYKNDLPEREGICSTGSYIELVTGDKRQYKFFTPKGLFTVRNKLVDPVWKKPDWAFVEDGLPIPPVNDKSRFEYGVLGDYALDIGNGYLIHGTLYQRFLGLPVTHGCVRLNDADLEFIYKNMPVGAKIFIY